MLSFACTCIIMIGAWVWATRIGNAGVVDVFWSFNFAVIAVITWFVADGDLLRKTIVCGIAVLWSLRLGFHLSARIFSHLGNEDARYKQLRKEWSANINTAFFFFFQAQALSNVVLAIPFFIIALNKQIPINVVEYTGATMWLVSVAGEAIADKQLKDFKSDPSNKGKVCDVGLWNYSRHPNYFFQLMIWISVFVFALPSPHGWIAIICPFSIGYLLLK